MANRINNSNQSELFSQAEEIIERLAPALAKSLRDKAEKAKKEEEIRIFVEREIKSLSDKLNIELEGEHEYTLLRGFVDSVYGRVFIEYNNPANPSSRLSLDRDAPGTQSVIEQIKGRFRDVSKLEGAKGKTLLGIGCDGRYFVFCRFVEGNVFVDEPEEVSRWSVRRFLFSVFNLGRSGKGLTPANLAEDFGVNSSIAKKGMRVFADSLLQFIKNPQVEVFFRQWKIHFSEVCGYDLESGKSKINELAEHYELQGYPTPMVLFALHTYYAVFMKLLTAHVLSEFQKIGSSVVKEITKCVSVDALNVKIKDLEEGGYFKHFKILNFLEGDLFSWYMSAWNEPLSDTIREIAEKISGYNAMTLRDDPARARDLLKHLYHQLLPKKIRHDLGEYYTPDWLAELTLNEVGYDGNPNSRVLDPACGSGTFLVIALNRVKKWYNENFERYPDERDIASLIIRNIVGFELNPIAVLAARANYLIQFFELFSSPGEFNVPIYLCDSILTPYETEETEYTGKTRELLEKTISVPTSAKLFKVPREVTTNQDILSEYCSLLGDYCLESSGFTFDDFEHRCRVSGIPVSDEYKNENRKLFDDIRNLDKEGKNRLWPRYIRNAFAPVFLKSEPFDFVVGNPPWIGWESLPGRIDAVGEGEENYRQRVAEVFKRYGLFSLKGYEGRLGGGKKDLSMLFVYTCVDHFLKTGGKLAFDITQTVFKTKGAGDGFRRFEYKAKTGKPGRPPTRYIKALKAVDLSDFLPFEKAANRTAIIVCQKAEQPTEYPAPYTVWRKVRRGKIDPDWPLEEVMKATERDELEAAPIEKKVKTSPWLSIPGDTNKIVKKIIGQSDYVAYAGCCTWLNGVFWIKVMREVPDGILITNLHNIGKIIVKEVTDVVEPDLVYPLLRSRDIRKWYLKPSAEIILTQDTTKRVGIDEKRMRREYPRTYLYLKKFEEELRNRSGFKKYFLRFCVNLNDVVSTCSK